jgi:hypothetical protein
LGHGMDGVGVIRITGIITTGMDITAMVATTATAAMGIPDTAVEPGTWATADMPGIQDMVALRDTWAAACIQGTAAAIISASVPESGVAAALTEASAAAVPDSAVVASTAAADSVAVSMVEAEAEASMAEAAVSMVEAAGTANE